MAFNNNERFQREYVSDNNRHMVQPIDCVPEERTKKGWTKGVKAWEKVDGSDIWVGWFTPPRKKVKAPSYGKSRRNSTLVLTRKGEQKTKVVNEKRLSINHENLSQELVQGENTIVLGRDDSPHIFRIIVT